MIRIFIGCAANWEDVESQSVLEYTLRKHTSQELEINWMKLSRDPTSPYYSEPSKKEGWSTSQWATPFSGFRWAVPELCGFEGKAIYMDSDVIVMADIAELWNQEFMPGKCVLAKGEVASWRYCISMWNCAKAKKWLWPLQRLQTQVESHRSMINVFTTRPSMVQRFDGNWNCLDGEGYKDLNDSDIKAIHYTSMPHQPHLTHALPRLKKKGMRHWFDGTIRRHFRHDMELLFNRELQEAIDNGYPPSKYEVEPLFGPYHKKSVSGMRGAVPAWGGKQLGGTGK